MVISSAAVDLFVQNMRAAAESCLPLRQQACMSCILTDTPVNPEFP